ncbi:ABC transporter permease [Mesorhizobium sp.]|uniref:ABC transporter permease n=1 Tax=Mesorhizobium sp. TaxID=1871066 RepID=UPI0025DDCC26|nr:ABC transporter permease [Mesorhizobium sp.]
MRGQRWIERSFWEDLQALMRQRELAWRLYLADVAEQRRNSGLGLVAPFISIFVHVILLGSVMGLVFHETLTNFIPFFAVSFALWQGLSISVSASAHANEKVANYIGFPGISGYVIHLANAYDFLIAVSLKILAVAIIIATVNFDVLMHANYLGFALGLVLTTFAMMCWSLPTAYVFDRFRLFRGFLPQFLFAVYLITPILWSPDRIRAHRWVVDFNPVYHLVEISRAPMLDGGWPLLSLAVVVGLCLLGMLVSCLVFPANRELVVFRWVA